MAHGRNVYRNPNSPDHPRENRMRSLSTSHSNEQTGPGVISTRTTLAEKLCRVNPSSDLRLIRCHPPVKDSGVVLRFPVPVESKRDLVARHEMSREVRQFYDGLEEAVILGNSFASDRDRIEILPPDPIVSFGEMDLGHEQGISGFLRSDPSLTSGSFSTSDVGRVRR